MLAEQGISAPTAFADPGVLAPDLFPPTNESEARLGIIPHYVDRKSRFVRRCKREGHLVLNVFSEPGVFFSDLARCSTVLSSSLHGLIFAHAYQKPAVWIELSDSVIGNGFKFYDYYSSVGFKPDHVSRCRVENETRATDLLRYASLADHTLLRQTFLSALSEAKDVYARAAANRKPTKRGS
jgi:pyruvyltransferase